MNVTEQQASDALPLALAAARLGISSDALRMRINRGKIRGFKRGGRLFAVLDEAPSQASSQAQRTARAETEQPVSGQSDQSEQARERPASVRSPGAGPSQGESSRRAAAPEPGEPSLPLVVEFQKVELSRLLRDNSRLNRRLDQHMEELRHLREMQQREQVLRQQDQALRQRAQALIERLTVSPVPAPPVPLPASVPPAPPPVSAGPASGPPLSGPMGPEAAGPKAEAAAPKKVPTWPDAGPSVSAAGPAGAAPDDASGDPAIQARDVGEPADLTAETFTYAYGKDAVPSAPSPASPPGPPAEAPPGPPGQSGEFSDGTRQDSTELADMLRDIGASLRGLDSADADELATVPPDRPRAEPDPPPVPGARRTPDDLAGLPPSPAPGPLVGPRPTPAAAPAPVPNARPRVDDADLLEILGRMGPSAGERRTAARLMKRLLKGRAPRRRGEPGDGAD